MLHSKVQFKKSQWQQFNGSMKELIKESYNLIELAVIDIGEFKFKSQYQHLVTPQSQWFKMTPQQREHHIMSKVSSTSVKVYSSNFGDGSNFGDSVPLSDLPGNVSLPMSVDDAKIQSVPKEVLEGIWRKAK